MAWAALGTAKLIAPLAAPGVGALALPGMAQVAASSTALAPATFGGELVVAALRHVPLMLLVVLHLCTVSAGGAEAPSPSGNSSATDQEDAYGDSEPEGSCSRVLGFNESQGPKDRSNQDLLGCDEHHKRTCCERNESVKVRNAWALFAQERSVRCARMGQAAICSLCDGDVGMGAKSNGNLVRLCPSFCSRWFTACMDDYFAPGGSGEGLAPCGPSALVCSPLREITEDFREFCAKVVAPLGASFEVAAVEEEPEQCFDGVPAARSRGAASRAPWSRPTTRAHGKEFWRRYFADATLDRIERYLPSEYEMRRLQRQIETYGPRITIATAVVMFGWILWARRDD